jgi:hypothetical protein
LRNIFLRTFVFFFNVGFRLLFWNALLIYFDSFFWVLAGTVLLLYRLHLLFVVFLVFKFIFFDRVFSIFIVRFLFLNWFFLILIFVFCIVFVIFCIFNGIFVILYILCRTFLFFCIFSRVFWFLYILYILYWVFSIFYIFRIFAIFCGRLLFWGFFLRIWYNIHYTFFTVRLLFYGWRLKFCLIFFGWHVRYGIRLCWMRLWIV